nr:helix-turn-helix transcriptional regulator [Maliibacterium massiliense]
MSQSDEKNAVMTDEQRYRAMCRRMRTLRKSLRLTQEQVSERAGISLHHYGMVERGRRRGNIFTLKRIAHALGVGLDYLIDGEKNDVYDDLHDMIDRISNADDLRTVKRFLSVMQQSGVYDAGHGEAPQTKDE